MIFMTFNYFQKEYQKYRVTESVNIEEKELLLVTKEMMSYLRGTRDDLHIKAVIDGKEQEFFNEKEIAHMEDVQVLFIGGQWLRVISGILFVIASAFLIFQNKKEFLFDIGQLFTFAIKNNRHKNILVTQIDDIIEVMNSILNSHNYLILYNHLCIEYLYNN